MNKLTYMLALPCLVLANPAAQASVFSVTDQKAFDTAVRQAVGGDTIVAKGTFGVSYIKHHQWTSQVTLDATAATFTDTLAISDTRNLKIIGGNYGNAVTSLAYGKAIYVNGVDGLSINNATVVGNYLTGGISVAASKNIDISGSSFKNVSLGVGFGGVTNGKLSKNTITGATKDGFDIADSHNVNVSFNSCTNGTPIVGAHPDCVQLWSVAGHSPLSDISVTDNYASGMTQGFNEFDHNQGGLIRGNISRNTVEGLMSQGLACYGCVDTVIADNRLVSLPGAEHVVNLVVSGGSGDTVRNNVLTGYDRKLALTTKFWTLAELTGGRVTAPQAAAGAVPEPSTWFTMLSGLLMSGIAMRRKAVKLVSVAA